MHKHDILLRGSDEKGLIFGLVFGVISFFGLIFGLIFGFGFSFGSIFSLIFGFGLIFGALSLIMLGDKHHQEPMTEDDHDFSILPVDLERTRAKKS